MTLNPYEKFLDGRDPISIARHTPEAVQQLAKKIGAAGMTRSYAPGKWTAAQILCHLADVEIAWGFRLRQAITMPHHTIQPFEQDDWAKVYPQMNATLALPTFLALRQWNLAFLDTVPKSEYGKPVTHPERGTMTVQQMLETLAGHDRNHLAQLETISSDTK